MMKVLFTTPILEHPAAGGPALRIENSIKALSSVCDLFIVSRVFQVCMGGKEAESFYKTVCSEFWYSPSATWSENKVVRRFRREWYKCFPYRDDVKFILDTIDRNKIDVLWCGYGNISFELIHGIKKLRPQLKVVCDTDSVRSRFIFRELPLEGDINRRKKIEKAGKAEELVERNLVDLCEVTAAVSEVDAQYYRQIAGAPERVKLFSNGIDLDTYQSTPPKLPNFRKPSIYLAGTFGHEYSPMDRAARWIIEEVLPIVKKTIPEVHFYMVGKDSQVVWGNLNDSSITVTGKVASVLPYLCHTDVAVIPLKFESGTRFKILEAGACRIPIVSTTLGAEGLPVLHGKHVLIADSPLEFAASIIRLINDKPLANELSANCYQLVRERYSVEHLSKEASEILSYLS